ncbi:MAG: helix-turn-helix transcriptional regulator [Bacillota bacterium]
MFPNIEAERARLGWSRMDLASRLDVSYSTLRNWMQGATEIPSSKIVEMAAMFHCTTDYLLGLRDDKNPNR